ncbi:hypothetical protein NC652_003907 [Populus alba x Populus x berolinensis]|uniref:Uncharacterized protein n=1 Tax=Populus alba x Populus x berolinensis TaxID=444605 RepID=A0AAD6RSS5_9ROSI|nr:hypothetical protein NC652_003907 [Populus alba x Populus x berolinensis]KAJ7014461.1 hypothetical protein NC653_003932 [Populus alba x Populus x berolinensis]
MVAVKQACSFRRSIRDHRIRISNRLDKRRKYMPNNPQNQSTCRKLIVPL